MIVHLIITFLCIVLPEVSSNVDSFHFILGLWLTEERIIFDPLHIRSLKTVPLADRRDPLLGSGGELGRHNLGGALLWHLLWHMVILHTIPLLNVEEVIIKTILLLLFNINGCSTPRFLKL